MMLEEKKTNSADYLVLGSGLAGLAFALKAAEMGTVIVVAKTKLNQSNTAMAQGGIAAVISSEDSFDQHFIDTIEAGAGLCNAETVRNVIEQAPKRIADLTDWGVQFDLSNSDEKIDLTREGGHSHRRILHVEDHTGKDIQLALQKQVERHPNIHILTNCYAVDLITSRQVESDSVDPNQCYGCHLFNKESGKMTTVLAQYTILATGGAGKVFKYTSNWSGATGDGIAMAWRAGCRVSNMEFTQFHPTCLYHPKARSFLITEAIRGEGGILRDQQGREFMQNYTPLKELAPRDIVARSIDAELKKSGDDCVFLDISHKPADFIISRFPIIHKQCLKFGIDMTKEPIPVVPAAHYLCGGILTDLNGCTDLKRLIAVGETACTGLHGANRLASNSLLECLAMVENAVDWIKTQPAIEPIPMDVPSLEQLDQKDDDEMIVIHHLWDEIRTLMWNYVGIVRTNKRLERASTRLRYIRSEIREYYSRFQPHSDIMELRNLALVALLIVESAIARKESRGSHFNLDFEDVDRSTRPSILDPCTSTLSDKS